MEYPENVNSVGRLNAELRERTGEVLVAKGSQFGRRCLEPRLLVLPARTTIESVRLVADRMFMSSKTLCELINAKKLWVIHYILPVGSQSNRLRDRRQTKNYKTYHGFPRSTLLRSAQSKKKTRRGPLSLPALPAASVPRHPSPKVSEQEKLRLSYARVKSANCLANVGRKRA